MKFLKMIVDKTSDRIALSILILVILYGIFSTFLPIGIGIKPEHNWENASLFTTFILTISLYINGYFSQKKLFKGITHYKLGIIGFLVLILVPAAIFLLGYNIAKNYLFIPRCWIMFILFVVALILSWIDLQIGQNTEVEKKYSQRYSTIFYTSDIPITFSLCILFVYSLFTKYLGYGDMDSFFPGAVAFQMLVSLFIWTFVDNMQDIVCKQQKTKD